MRRKFFIRYILPALSAALLWLLPSPGRAQTDAPFNPGFDLDMMINPAACGLSHETYDPFFRDYAGVNGSNRNLRHGINLNYKNQLQGAFNAQALRILTAGYQCKFFNERMALGLYVYSNTLNKQAMQDVQVAVNYAYHWVIEADASTNPIHRLSFGLQAVYRNFGYNTANMQTGSMYDPAYTGGVNPGSGHFNDLPDNRNLFDGHFGVQYTGVFSGLWRVEAGFGLFHMFQPRTGLVEQDYRVPFRFSGQAAAYITIPSSSRNKESKSELGLKAYYTYQDTRTISDLASTIFAGLSYRYIFSPSLSLSVAFFFRSPNTYIPQISLDVERFSILFQFEFNGSYSYNNMLGLGLSYRL